MAKRNEIKAVEMVRHIRDEHAAILIGKSNAEIIKFFKTAGDAAREEALRRRKERAKALQRG